MRLQRSTLHRRLCSQWGGQPSVSMVYMNLQPPDGTARRSPAGWWSLTPPSHPYPTLSVLFEGSLRKALTGRSFSSSVSNCRQLLLLSEVECPVLPGLSSRRFLSFSTKGKEVKQPAASRSSAFGMQKYEKRVNCQSIFGRINAIRP